MTRFFRHAAAIFAALMTAATFVPVVDVPDTAASYARPALA